MSPATRDFPIRKRENRPSFESIRLGFERVFLAIIAQHIVRIAERSPFDGAAHFGIRTHQLAKTRINVPEKEFIGGLIDVVLGIIQVVTAFQHLEKIRLALVIGRIPFENGLVALGNIGLLHADNHIVNLRDVARTVRMDGKLRFGQRRGTGDKNSRKTNDSNPTTKHENSYVIFPARTKVT